jgi:LruC domain-containing protein
LLLKFAVILKLQLLRTVLKASGIIILLVTCHKRPFPISEEPKNMEDLKVPATFSWETSREVSITVAVDFTGASIGKLDRINIYSGNPYENAGLLLTGSVGYNYPFTSTMRIPTSLTVVFLELKGYDGDYQLVSQPVSDDIHYTFTEINPLKAMNQVADPTCTSGCNQNLTGSGSVTISNGQTYCIPSTYSGTVQINKGTLKICGTYNGNISMGQGNNTCDLVITAGGNATIGSLTMQQKAKIYVYNSSSATIGTITMNQTSRLFNYGTATINSNFTPNDSVVNFGTLTINGEYNMNGSSGVLINSGSISVTTNWNVVNYCNNQGSIDVVGSINFNNSDVINGCKIISHDGINFNNVDYTSNAGYIRAYNGMTVNGNAVIILQNQSMMSSAVFVMNNDVVGQGSSNVIKCSTSGRINGNKYVGGPVEMLTPDGTLVVGSYPANFTNGAVLHSIANAQIYIPITTCNPEGSGNPPVTDTDGDGVPDNLDDYPTDYTRAYDNWYPSKTTWGTLGFEDLWPGRGDYDLNDAVIDYQFRVVTSAWNKVVDVKPKFYVRAVGAGLENGFGWQFDNLIPATVESVVITYAGQPHDPWTYVSIAANGTENNQQKAVIIVYENHNNVINRVGGTFYNTEPNEPYGYSDTINVNLHFNPPQLPTDVGTPPFNPFIIKNLTRGIEIHLPDYIPTSLANTSLFQTEDDDSDPAIGRYYKTDGNLPWGINITQKYDYTWERVQIVYGHLKFGAWAESGGIDYPDWYKNLPGYRNPSEIYTPPTK